MLLSPSIAPIPWNPCVLLSFLSNLLAYCAFTTCNFFLLLFSLSERNEVTSYVKQSYAFITEIVGGPFRSTGCFGGRVCSMVTYVLVPGRISQEEGAPGKKKKKELCEQEGVGCL